jgi:hypothetical protein
MKKINLSFISRQIGKTILRFPVATLCCVALCVIEILYINDVYFDVSSDPFFKLNLLLPLGFVLSIAVRLFMEDLDCRGWRSYADVLVIPLLALYYYLLPKENDFNDTALICYVIFCLVAVIGLFIAPFRSLKQPSWFWVYNVKIWWRVLLSVICTAIFLGGSCLALVSIDALFDVNISDKWYQYLVIFWGILFASLFFAAGIPARSQRIKGEEKNYGILRVFGQFVLLPVLLLYLLILYTYGLKIIISWQLPEGWVSWLTIAYSVAGLFIYFLLHHFFIMKATKVATLFGRYFFYSELPIIALLFVAIIRRTIDYGITENRYFLWLGAFWLLGISLYMIFTKGKSFRPVFISLAVVALLSIMGPWSAFNVSDCSQMNRLKDLLAKNNMLQDGKYIYNSSVSQSEAQEIKNIVFYFAKKGNAYHLQPLFTHNIDSLYQENGYYESVASALLDPLNTEKVGTENEYRSFTISTNEYHEAPIPIAGYGELIVFIYFEGDVNNDSLTKEEATLAHVIKQRENGYIDIYHYGALYKTISLTDVVQQITAINWNDDVSDYNIAMDEMSVVIDSQYKIIFTEIQGSYRNQSPDIRYAKMYILDKGDQAKR